MRSGIVKLREFNDLGGTGWRSGRIFGRSGAP